MSTYAEYWLWAGIARDRHGKWAIEGEWPPFLTAVRKSGLDGVERDGLRFVGISMHGENVGIGVVIHEFGWTTEIGVKNAYDPAISERARDVLERVRHIFAQEGVRARVELYHHLDLGG
ncbi:MAG: hypothetical protein Q8R16_03895 [bacterium]|nr:hypothetical protein [bacterium]